MGTIKIQAKNISKTVLKKHISVAKTIMEDAGHIIKEATNGNVQLNAKKAINLRSETGITHESYNPTQPEPVYEEVTTMQLQSTFALEQLQKMAKKDSLYMFRHHIKKKYGIYFTGKAIDQLYQDAKEATVTNPEIKVVRFISPPNAYGAYNNETQEILVSQKLIKEALADNDKMGELLVVLVEEFCAHINWLLRNEYTPDEDKPKLHPRKFTQVDKGAQFAGFLLDFNYIDTQNQAFAELTDTTTNYENREETGSTESTQTLVWDYQEVHTKLNEYVNQARQNTSDVAGSYNFYKAGHIEGDDKYGHLDIEEEALKDVVSEMKFGIKYNKLKNESLKDEIKEIIHKIYLGNWLRDYSQVVDPGMVRPMADKIIDYAKNTSHKCDTPELTKAEQKKRTEEKVSKLNKKLDVCLPNDFQIFDPNYKGWNPVMYIDPKILYKSKTLRPVTISRELLTTFVEMLAIKEFIHLKEGDTLNENNYDKQIAYFKKNYIEITPKVLGVYRPEEHIDNPKSDDDKSGALLLNYNADGPEKPFESNTDPEDMGFVGNPKPRELDINKAFGMKNYIRNNEGVALSTGRTAYEYVIYKIEQACAVRNANFSNIQPMVHLGAALHVMEDYFAHTNFAEISAAKVSTNDRVFPWVDKVGSFDYDKFAKLPPKQAKAYLLKPSTSSIIPDKDVKVDTNVLPKDQYNHIARFIPLVTGSFGKLDMMASLLPILEKHFSIEIEDYSRINSGDRTMGDMLAKEALKDIDRAQSADGSGTDDDSYSKKFEKYLAFRDGYADLKKLLPKKMREGFHYIFEYIGAALNFTIYIMLRNFGGEIDTAQLLMQEQILEAEANKNKTGIAKISIGTNPTHTQIAKDDDHKPMHSLSAKLAVYVVRHIGAKVLKYWKSDASVSLESIKKDIDTLFKHPAASSWQDKMVKEWCDANKHLVCKASTPSVTIDTLIDSIEEMNTFTQKLITASKKDDGKTTILESILETYDKDSVLIGQYRRLLKNGKDLLDRAIKIKEASDYTKYYRPYYCPQPAKPKKD